MKKAKACFADGGVVGADGLTDAQRAKLMGARSSLGVSNAPPVQPTPAAAPVAPVAQQAAPPQQGIGQGIVNILKNRGAQIDKAAGYANGGVPGLGGKIKGAGTPTSDSIDAEVNETGEPIKVSTDERILSKAQDMALEGLARSQGFKNLEEMLVTLTGKPVGPTIKDGVKAAAGGWSIDNEPDAYNKAMPKLPPFFSAQDEKIGPSQTPVGLDKVPSAIGNFLSDTAKAARGEGDYTALRAARNGIAADVPTATAAQTGVNPLVQNYSNEGRSVPQPITKANPGVIVDNEITQGGKTYSVNPTNQQGISRVTAPGTNPLYTNIDPAKAITGLKDQTIGQPAGEAALGIARAANANKIRGEMIANRDKDIPAGGYAPSILADQSVSDNAALNAMRNSAMVSGLSPSQQAAFLQQQSELALRDKGQGITADVARYGHDVQAQRAAGHDNVLMRGQDLNAKDQAEENANKRETNRLLELKLGQEKAQDYSKRYLQAPNRKIYNDMGQVIGEEPGGWFDAASGQMVGGRQQAQERPIPQGYTVVGTSNGRRVLQDAQGKRFTEGS